MNSVNIFGIIIVVLQVIFLILEIIYYKDGQLEKGLLMNIIIILLAILNCMRNI